VSDSHKMLDTFLHQGVRPARSFGRKGVAEAEAVAAEAAAQQAAAKAEAERFADAVAGFKVGGDQSDGGDQTEVAGFSLPNDDQARLMVRGMIAAAKADGVLDDFERSAILDRFHDLDGDDVAFVKEELKKPLDIQALAAEAKAEGIGTELYIATLLAIDIDTEEEERYLGDLAELLDLDADTIADLHARFANAGLAGDAVDKPASSMNEWYFAVDGRREGPMHLLLASRFAKLNPQARCWRAGYQSWVPISEAPELAIADQPVFRYTGKERSDEEIDFNIFGDETQFVEVELDPGECAIGEAGALMYKDTLVRMEVILGDGAAPETGILGKIGAAGKRVLTGENLFLTLFTNNDEKRKARVAFAAPYPGTIVPLKLDHYGGKVICQKDCFLAAAKGVSIGVHLQRKLSAGFFGGEGFIMQALEGDGWVFVHAGGTIVERDLAPGETLDVETGAVVGFTDQVGFDISPAGGVKTMLFGGEGLFLAHLKGPGKVWLQSLPVAKLAARLAASVPVEKT